MRAQHVEPLELRKVEREIARDSVDLADLLVHDQEVPLLSLLVDRDLKGRSHIVRDHAVININPFERRRADENVQGIGGVRREHLVVRAVEYAAVIFPREIVFSLHERVLDDHFIDPGEDVPGHERTAEHLVAVPRAEIEVALFRFAGSDAPCGIGLFLQIIARIRLDNNRCGVRTLSVLLAVVSESCVNDGNRRIDDFFRAVHVRDKARDNRHLICRVTLFTPRRPTVFILITPCIIERRVSSKSLLVIILKHIVVGDNFAEIPVVELSAVSGGIVPEEVVGHELIVERIGSDRVERGVALRRAEAAGRIFADAPFLLV